MLLSRDAKRRALRRLAKTKEKAQRLEFELRVQGLDEDAKKVDSKTRKLTKRIDELLKKTMEEWMGNAAQVEADLKTNNEKLQKSIRDIKNKVRTAKNIVKAIGFIDDAVSIAGKLVLTS